MSAYYTILMRDIDRESFRVTLPQNKVLIETTPAPNCDPLSIGQNSLQ